MTHDKQLMQNDTQNYRIISGDPPFQSFSPEMTDEKWQQYFGEMKNEVKPFLSKHKKMHYSDYEKKYGGKVSPVSCDDYQQWIMYYVAFINNILSNIRKGGVDFTYFGYHIIDLLCFEYDRLRTRYLPESQSVKVWLE